MGFYLKLDIPGLPRTTNSISRAHWAVKAKESRKWRWCVVMMVGDKCPEKPLKKARLILTRHSSSNPDFDGLVSSFKAPIDGLVDAGVIENDRFENIGAPEYVWQKTGRRGGKITIEVLELAVPPTILV